MRKKERRPLARACDTRAVSATACGLDWLTVTRKESGMAGTQAAIGWAREYTATKKGDGDEAKLQGFVGEEILNGYGFIGRRENTILVNLPGQALDELRRRGFTDHQIAENFHPEWRASRLDVAIDTQNPTITPELFWSYYRAGVVTCKADEARTMETFKRNGAHSMTVYVGSSQSVRMLRVYDKRQEKAFKTGQDIGHALTRFELQSRHEAADKTLQFIAFEGMPIAPKLLNGWLTVRTLTGRAEVKKRDQADWWSELVGGEKYLALDPRAATPDKTLAWLQSEGVARALKLADEFGKSEKIAAAKDDAEPTNKQRARWRSRFNPGESGGDPIAAIKGK